MTSYDTTYEVLFILQESEKYILKKYSFNQVLTVI